MAGKKGLIDTGAWVKHGLKAGAVIGAAGLTLLCSPHCTAWYEWPAVAVTGALVGAPVVAAIAASVSAMGNMLVGEREV